MSDTQGGTLVLEELAPQILQIRLNRPERLNAIDDIMRDELTATLRSLPERIKAHDLRVVVVTGTGRAFCSGGDMKEFPRIFGPTADAEREMRAFQEISRLLVGLDIPVLAAVNGLAGGGGFVLACACDLRIAAKSGRFALSFVDRGLGLDLGGSYFVSRLIGMGRAMRLAMTGEFLTASEAEHVGLVNWVVPDAELGKRTREVAQSLASRSEAALRFIKRALYRSAGDLDVALELEASAQVRALASMEGSPPPIR